MSFFEIVRRALISRAALNLLTARQLRVRRLDDRVAAIVEFLESRRLLTQNPVILDNSDAAFSDVRTWGGETGGYLGTVATAGSTVSGAFASWNFSGLANGQYYLQATWTPGADRATNATFTVRSQFGDSPDMTATVNQQLSPIADFQSGSTAFHTLQVVTVYSGTLSVELTNPGANGKVVADAIRLVQAAATDNSVAVRTERLHQIVLSMFEYQSTYRQFPPNNVSGFLDSNNQPYLSWRVDLLPFLGYGDLYLKFHLNEPWNSPNNLPLLSQMPDIFRSRDLAANSTSTGFQRITSSDAYHIDGSGGPTFRDMTDDSLTTLLLLETSASQAVPWTAPNDTPYFPEQPLNILTPAPLDFILAAMADGTIHELSPNISASDFRALVTWRGGEIISNATESTIFVDQAPNPDQQSQNKLKQIALALANYSGTYGVFPPDRNNAPANWFDANGHPNLSWRVLLLPYLGYESLYVKFHFDEPWNSPNNFALINEMPEAYRSRGVTAGSSVTGYQVVTGSGEYVMDNSRSNRYANLTDGSQQTISVIEMPSTAAVTWTRPDGDIAFNPANPLAGLGTIPASGLWCATFDGLVHLISPQVTAANFAAAVTWSGGEFLSPADFANIFSDWAAPESIVLRKQNLGKIGLALHNYQSTYSSFPVSGSLDKFDSNGKPLLSWRVYLLPYLGYAALFNQFHLNEPWNSANNLPLLADMPDVFRSRGLAAGTDLTGIQLLYGPGAYQQPALQSWGGYGPTLNSMVDGTSNTIMAVETPPAEAVEWTRPDGDVQFNSSNPLAGLGLIGLQNTPADGLLALLADGSVRNIQPSIPAADFKALATWAGGEILGTTDVSQSFFDTQFQNSIPVPDYSDYVSSSRQLKELILAVHNYMDLNTFEYPPSGGLPPSYYDASGKSKLSWRVYLLPYLGYDSLYNQFHFDEAWNSPDNLPLLGDMPDVFRSRGLPLGTTVTGFQFISGPQAYDPSLDHSSEASQVSDGTSNTIGIIETPREQAVNWTQPDDFPFNPADPLASLRAEVGDYLAVAMLDGTVHALNPQIDAASASALITWAGGETVNFPSSSSPTPEIAVFNGTQYFWNDTDVASFGTTNLGTPVSQTLTVTNNGNQALAISSIQLPAGYSLTTSISSVAANRSSQFTIQLNATTGGRVSGLISLTTNAPDQPTLTFTLDGFVNAPHAQLQDNVSTIADGTGTSAFGTTQPGQPVSKTFTVSNTGQLPLIVQPVSVPAGFVVTSNLTAGQSIAAGDHATFIVQLVASAKGTFSGLASFGTNDSNNNPYQFTLTGLVESAPTGINLSNAKILEKQPIGTIVGVLTSTDPDAGDAFTYSLVTGAGSDDNSSFSIDASGNLLSAAIFNYATKKSASIRVRTTDSGGLTFEQVFTVQIVSPPHLQLPTSITTRLNTAFTLTRVNAITVIDAAGSGSGETVTIASLHGTLNLGTTTGLTVTGNGTASLGVSGTRTAVNTALPSLIYTPKTGYTGADTLGLTVLDSTDHLNGPAAQITVSVSPPYFQLPGSIATNINTPFNLTGLNAITVIDTEGTGSHETATIAALKGTLNLGSTTGLTVTGNGTATLSISGTRTAVNTALPSLVYTPTMGYSGADQLSLTVSDSTDQLNGFAAKMNITVINVSPPHLQAPASLTTKLNTPITLTGVNAITVIDPAGSGSHQTTTISALHGTLNLGTTTGLTITGNGTASLTISGTRTAVNTAFPSLVYTPTTGFSGADTLSLTVSDTTDQLNGPKTQIAISVNPPQLHVPKSVATNVNTALTLSGTNAISVTDTAGGGNNSETLTITALHGNLNLGAMAGLTITGNGTASLILSGTLSVLNSALPGLIYAPATGFIGADTLSLTILDSTDQLYGSGALIAVDV